MTPAELNALDEVLLMIDENIDLIIIRAKRIRGDCLDPHMYATQLKSNCCNNATEIQEMAESIEKGKKPFLFLIEQQRKKKTVTLGNERPMPV